MRTRAWVLVVAACGKPAQEPPAEPPRPVTAPAAPADAAVPDATAPAPSASAEAAVPRRLWAGKLDTEAEFLAYSQEIGGERFAKFVVDLHTDAIYYFDVDVYKVHKDFIFQELYRKPRTKAATRIFDRNYGKQKTDFLMCYLIHHLNQDAWTFAFWDGDLATADHVRHAYRRMKQTFVHGDRVKFRPDLPVADLSVTELATLDRMRGKDVVVYGTKASALGEILAARLDGFEVPPGFGVPFAYYDAHLAAAGIDKQVAALLAAPPRDAAARRQRLEALREAIVAAPVSDELRAKVDDALGALTDHDLARGVFVRSSSNAEDLPAFSGAGLYDTLPNVKGTEQVLAAIKQVWASLWNFAAYENRQRSGIDHATAHAAVLIQLGVDATAAGVLVTAHPTDPTDERNYTINAKSGLGIRVVDGKRVPESLLVSWYNHGIRVLSRSAEDTKLVFDESGGVHEVANPDAGKPVLTNRMAILLADSAKHLTRVFRRDRLDIEWVFASDKLYIVQSRPYVTE